MAAAHGIASIVSRRRAARGLRGPERLQPRRGRRRGRRGRRPGEGPGHGRGARRRDRLHAAARPRSFAPSGPEPVPRHADHDHRRQRPDRHAAHADPASSAATRSRRSRCAATRTSTAKLAGRDAVVHLAGENVAQRWTDDARSRIQRVARAGHAAPGRRRSRRPTRVPHALISASAVGYYGPHGDERLDEDAPPGDDFLAQVCVALGARGAAGRAARPARRPRAHRRRCSTPSGGALSKMLLPFKLGAGGPVAGGRQYMPWIHIDDVVGIFVPRSTATGRARSTPRPRNR